MLSLEVLPARHGDALLISWGPAKKPYRMLIDAGPTSQGRVVAERLRQFEEPIELFIITHIDADHIGGVLKLLNERDIATRIKAVWFNGYQQIEKAVDMLGAMQGEKLSRKIQQLKIPWNIGWPREVSATIGGPVVRPLGAKPPVVKLPGRATLTVLGPTPDRLSALQADWEETLRKAGLVPGAVPEPEPAAPPPGDMLGGSLDDLANLPSPTDQSTPNGSSIAAVFSYGRQRLLLTGDGHADCLVDGLKQLGTPYRVDVCKAPHHGSRGNVLPEFVAALDCRQWIFSSNGEQFFHPHAEALARVIRGSAGEPLLIGNYASDEWATFLANFPPQEHGYQVHLPPDDRPGVVWPLR